MSARESLAEVFGEGGHGDNSQRFADELYAEIRAEVLREAASIAGEFTSRFADMDAMKTAGLIGPFTMSAAIRDELHRVADEAVR